MAVGEGRGRMFLKFQFSFQWAKKCSMGRTVSIFFVYLTTAHIETQERVCKLHTARGIETYKLSYILRMIQTNYNFIIN